MTRAILLALLCVGCGPNVEYEKRLEDMERRSDFAAAARLRQQQDTHTRCIGAGGIPIMRPNTYGRIEDQFVVTRCDFPGRHIGVN